VSALAPVVESEDEKNENGAEPEASVTAAETEPVESEDEPEDEVD